MRIVFMGTPDYAQKTLAALFSAGHDIAAVFTQPDKPVGRKQILTPPPVKLFAKEKGIPVYQPSTLKDGEAAETIRRIAPDVIVVVAYGKILPQEILDIPRFGCVNGHGSLLPALRGASPIQWAVVSGLKKTGVTVMLMDKGMDTGDILAVSETEIAPDETADELFERMGDITARLMVSTLPELEKGALVPEKQDESRATYAPVIKKEMALMDFSQTAETVYNKIRGFYSWPCAYFITEGRRVKVHKARLYGRTEALPGTVVKSDKTLVIACGDGNGVEMLTLQPEGKKPMSASDMLRGNPIPAGSRIS